MDKQKVGLILFYKAIGWAVIVSVVGSLSVSATNVRRVVIVRLNKYIKRIEITPSVTL
ncbi:MAG: hypothetical protein IIC39_02340 [Candidatus Marinimicrobia bacterium]|nr:hypothetical protein [Candidatus Neomarinimicrobiota bacterium]